MDLEIVGRHALLFDEDSTAAFLNSGDALVDWNSLLIDRYDVRHLLQGPPPPRKRRLQQPSSSSPSPLELELDQERYLDLPLPSDEQDQSSSLPESDNGIEPAHAGAYRAVAFTYGNLDVSSNQKNSDSGVGYSGFLPPFSVPESLLQNLPPTEKVHQIIARTAIFISKHGGQSEFILRVKQGDNPSFGFLMPDNHLHPYFRFLVDHPELMKSDMDVKPQEEGNKDGAGHNRTNDVAGGALSLLGSFYGSTEDEDRALQLIPESKEKEPCESFDAANTNPSHVTKQVESSVNLAGKDGAATKHPLSAAKENAPSLKRNRIVSAGNAGNLSSNKSEGNALGSLCGTVDKPQSSALPSAFKVESLIMEPPSNVKRLVDKIVEFILKNGKDFESVLIEQDTKNGRFPFLLPSDQYHPYYLNVLEKAQESKLPGKSSISQKHDSTGRGVGRKSVLSKESDTIPKGSVSHDIPYDPDRKEKFKMVIGGSKKDAQDPPSKITQQQFGVSLDATAAAAILQAARRGLRNPNLDILSRSSLDNVDQGFSNEGGPASSFGSLSFSSRAQSSTPKPVHNGETSGSLPVEFSGSGFQLEKEATSKTSLLLAKAIAKTAALTAASEADSSEAGLTKEQKQKAERLKRAKMFAAMIKSGGVPKKDELLPRLSAEPSDSAFSGCIGSVSKDVKNESSKQATDVSNLSGAEDLDFVGREREGSSVPLDVDIKDRMEKSKKKETDDDHKERRSRKSHSRSKRLEEYDEDDDGDESNHKHSRKKHRSHRSSHHSRDEHKPRKRHSSSKDSESRYRRRRHHSSSEDECCHQSKSSKRRTSSHSVREVGLEDGFSEDECCRHQSRLYKHRRAHSEREVEQLEDGEISTRLSSHSNTITVADGASREASVDPSSNAHQDGQATSMVNIQPSNTTEVSDDLRAKVRAMLLATM